MSRAHQPDSMPAYQCDNKANFKRHGVPKEGAIALKSLP